MTSSDVDLALLLQQISTISQEPQPTDRSEWEWRRDQGWDAIGRMVRFLASKGLRPNMELVPLTRVHQALRDLDRGVVSDILRPRERDTSGRPRSQRFDHMVATIIVGVQILADSGVPLGEAHETVATTFRASGHVTWQRQPMNRRAVRDWWNGRDAKWAVTNWRAAYSSQRQAFANLEPYPLSRDRAAWAIKKLAEHPILKNDGYLAS